jgi:TolB-like protein/DNA-binding winged helix-turn-helix (wHTH) protein/Tfp pilus assembly protein PilF
MLCGGVWARWKAASIKPEKIFSELNLNKQASHFRKFSEGGTTPMQSTSDVILSPGPRNVAVEGRMEQVPSSSSLKFGPYLVDLYSGELRKGGSKVRLQEKPLRLLAALAERHGQVVTREELKKRLWPDHTFVDFETGLNTAVSKVRDALSDNSEKPRYIETLPRRGYRFLVPVERIAGGNGAAARPPLGAAIPANTAIAPAPAVQLRASSLNGARAASVATKKSRFALAGVALILACVAIGLGVRVALKERPHPAPSTGRVMLVVLPFENLTGDSGQEYVSDGFTEEMIAQLGAMNHDRMGVIARTSAMHYKGSSKSIREIAQELGVNYALEGSIRKAGNGFRITAQLVRTDDQTHLWARDYDRSRDDLAKLEGEVAQDIARQIEVQLTPQAQLALSNSHLATPDAYRTYLKGRYYLNERSRAGMNDAISAFNEAIREDPAYAPSYSGLADTYNQLVYYGFLAGQDGIPKARAAAQSAVELGGSQAEGHASLAYVDFMWDLNWAGAAKEFQRAIELDGNYAPAHHWYALYLTAQGERQASLAQIRQAQRLDPLSLIVTTAAAYVSYFAGDYGNAASLSQQALQRDPDFMVAHAVLGLAREQQGQTDAAVDEFQKTLELSGGRPPAYLDYLAHAYAAAGKRAEAEQVLAELDRQQGPHRAAPIYRAATLAALGEKDKALDAIEESATGGSDGMIWLKVDPRFETLYSDARYQRVLRLAGFSQ